MPGNYPDGLDLRDQGTLGGRIWKWMRWNIWHDLNWRLLDPEKPQRCCSGEIGTLRIENDGDIDIKLTPDDGFQSLLSEKNKGKLGCEIDLWDRSKFNEQLLLALRGKTDNHPGSRITVCGTWVTDVGHALTDFICRSGENELHPVSSIALDVPPPPPPLPGQTGQAAICTWAAAVCTWAIRLRRQCTDWATEQRQKCVQERDEGYNKCTETRDEGYNKCTETRDEGYKNCCDWWPCSWLCQAWVWVSNIVCVVWTWVSNLVCVAWTWISSIVCIAWTWVVSTTCKAFTWVVENATCWART